MTSTDRHQGTQDAAAGTGARAAEAPPVDTPPGDTPPGDTPPGDTPPGDVARDDDSASASRIEELEGRWRRAAADLENLRKRFARDAERDREAERDRTAAAWLPVLDHLELALAHADADPRSIVAGVRAVRDQAVGVLDRLGYPRHDEVGVPFDPARHDVLSVVEEPEVPPGTVVAVVRPGYGDTGRQLRPVGVAVSRPPADEAEGRQGSDARGSLEGRRRRDDVPPAPAADSDMAREPGPGGRETGGTAE